MSKVFLKNLKRSSFKAFDQDGGQPFQAQHWMLKIFVHGIKLKSFVKKMEETVFGSCVQIKYLRNICSVFYFSYHNYIIYKMECFFTKYI